MLIVKCRAFFICKRARSHYLALIQARATTHEQWNRVIASFVPDRSQAAAFGLSIAPGQPTNSGESEYCIVGGELPPMNNRSLAGFGLPGLAGIECRRIGYHSKLREGLQFIGNALRAEWRVCIH
jgi:hypothetical protein